MRHRDTEQGTERRGSKIEDGRSMPRLRNLRSSILYPRSSLCLCLVCLCGVLLFTLTGGCDRRAAETAKRAGKAVLVVSGDTASWLTPCGCTSNQSGGLLRRATYLKGLASGGGTAVLYADVGGAPGGTSE